MGKAILFKGGTVVDGTGTPARIADVLIEGDQIVAVGSIDAPAGAEIVDATGLHVTPGFVDIHTHYDGQVFWDPLLTPSSWHGATTVVMGNCGVGFAPMHPDQREPLIKLMHHIEDIPAETLREGMPWSWETFADYLDRLDQIPRAIDIGTLVPHGVVRSYVMGAREAEVEATPEELEQIVRIIGDAIDAGALGCSGNRGTHGGIVPGSFATEPEMIAIAEAVGSRGGIFEVNPNGNANSREQVEVELGLLRRMSLAGDLAISLPLTQYHRDPEGWRHLLGLIEDANAHGARLIPQCLARPLNIVMALAGHQPFANLPIYDELIAGARTTAEKAARLAEPEVRAKLFEAAKEGLASRGPLFDALYEMTDPPVYEPLPETSIGNRARAAGLSPAEVFYDAMLADNGSATFLATMANYAEGNSDVVFEMIHHPDVILGLSDGGAHVLSLCDASAPTTMLAYWVRDRVRGPLLPIELSVQKLTSHPARAFKMEDRGVIAPGLRADINLIDLDKLRMGVPEFLDDLPAGGRRMVQRAQGYVATYVAGECVFREGKETGARPGRTIRKARVKVPEPA